MPIDLLTVAVTMAGLAGLFLLAAFLRHLVDFLFAMRKIKIAIRKEMDRMKEMDKMKEMEGIKDDENGG